MSENILEVRHLKKYFPTKRGLLHAVDDVNFSIKKGTTMGLVGESGCGKSTIAGLLTGTLKGYQGKIAIGGVELSEIKEEEILKNITSVFPS